jgi:hypothetical protein
VEVKSTEQWRPGEVDITKITKRFPYLVATGLDPPPPQDIPPNTLATALIVESTDGPRPISKLSCHWARRLEQRKELKASKKLEANAIKEAITQAMLDSGASKTLVNSRRGMQCTGLSDKVVVTADGTEHPASHTNLLPTQALSKGAREAIVIPGMQQKALLSVGTLADNGYTTVFFSGQQGIQIYGTDDINISPNEPPSLQGWRDERGLWMVPIALTAQTSILSSQPTVFMNYQAQKRWLDFCMQHWATQQRQQCLPRQSMATSSLFQVSHPKISPDTFPNRMKLKRGI